MKLRVCLIPHLPGHDVSEGLFNMRFLHLNWVALTLCFAIVRVYPQEELVPSFRTQSEVVLVDVVVTDKRGNFIGDLKLEEIQVFEDGKQQKLTFFDLRRRAGLEEQLVSEIKPLKPPQSALSRRSIPITPMDRGYFVFLFDLQSISFHGLERAKDSIRKFSRSQLAPADQIMVATIRPNFHIEMPFTSNISRLENTLDKLIYRGFEQASISRFLEQMDHAFARMEGGALDTFDPGAMGPDRLEPALEGAISEAAVSGRDILVGIELKIDFTCAAISALSRHLGSLPGRKQLLYISNGYPLDVKHTLTHLISQRAISYAPGQIIQIHLATNNFMSGTGRTSNLLSKLKSAVNQANRSQVSVYSIDPRGLMTPPISNAGNKGSGSYLYPSYSTEDLTAPHQFLASLSLGTGGLWFADDNDLARPLRKSYRDGREYYLLGYVPTVVRKAGKYHKIKVKIRRKGLKLRYREEYIEEDPQETKTVDLANAFKFPDLFKDFPIDTQISNQKGKLKIQARIPTNAFTFSSEGKKNRCVIELFGALFDRSGKWVGDNFYFAEQIDLDFDEIDLAKFRRYKYFVPMAEQVAPSGPHDLVVVVRQKLTGSMSTSTHKFAFE